jgi:hypothetical protein
VTGRANSVTAHNFSADGKKVFALTKDQTACEFEVPSGTVAAASGLQFVALRRQC